MRLVLFQILLFCSVNADPLPQTCISAMGEFLNLSSFVESVAHGVHSMTIDDAKFYFDANIGDKIKIPTINQNISGEVLLEYLPYANYDEELPTMALKNLDIVMRNIGNDDWSIRGLNTLEKLAHVIHMQALWKRAGETYKMFVVNPPENPQFCSCINLIGQNELLEALFGMAERIRAEELDFNDLKEGHKIKRSPSPAKERYRRFKIKYKKFKIGNQKSSLEHRSKRSPSPRKEGYRGFKVKYKKFELQNRKPSLEHRSRRSPSPKKIEHYRRFKNYELWKPTYKRFESLEHRNKRSPSPRKDDYRRFKIKYKKFKMARQKRSPEAKRMYTKLRYKAWYPSSKGLNKSLQKRSLENNEIQSDQDQDMPELKDSESWKEWKAMLQESMMKEDEYKNLAAYMFCSLKRNELDV